MATRRELITEKYTAVREEVQKIFPEEVFPSLEEVDLADVVTLISITFMGPDIATPLRNIVSFHSKQYTEEQFQKLLLVVEPFVVWFKQLK